MLNGSLTTTGQEAYSMDIKAPKASFPTCASRWLVAYLLLFFSCVAFAKSAKQNSFLKSLRAYLASQASSDGVGVILDVKLEGKILSVHVVSPDLPVKYFFSFYSYTVIGTGDSLFVNHDTCKSFSISKIRLIGIAAETKKGIEADTDCKTAHRIYKMKRDGVSSDKLTKMLLKKTHASVIWKSS